MVAEAEAIEDESYAIDCPVLATERLVMRAPRDVDVEQLVALADNRHVAEMLARMPHPYGEAEARTFLAMASSRRAGIVYALTVKDSGAFVGCAGLNTTDRGLELGYWIGEPFWKRGYATEAAHALVDLAFQKTSIQVLHASTRVINPASRRVIHKCGFQYAGQGMLNSIVAGQVPVERYRL
ncbi:GNAT family N-acetyltransferase, partial [Mesorhizobium sp.]|uniref:GNAT family N-acetyltransferase n=1 Tax=Mesorhizobium sp. TaxID=1871066 RepID=UPI0025D64882